MTTETASPVEGMSSVDLPADAPESFNSVSEAAAYFTELQEKRKNPSAESADTATAEPELAQANDDPAEPAPVEATEDAEPEAELPPIERPRSWSKDDDDEWNALPRARQEKIAANERAREADIRQRINEAAEQRKAVEAKLAKLDEVVTGYKAQDDAYEKETLEKFPNIKSQEDIDFLTNEMLRASNEGDLARFAQIQSYLTAFQAHNQKWAGIRASRANAEQLRDTERRSDWAKLVQEENSKAAQFIPELTDPIKGEALTKRVATELLPELGFKDDELADVASGKKLLPIYDHRIQRLLADALKLRDIQKAPKAIAAKPLPPVQKPGTSKPAGSDVSERIQALNRKPELTLKEAEELYSLQSRQTRRAS